MAHVMLVNPNSSQSATDTMLEVAQAAAPAGWRVSGVTAADGPPLITGQAQLDAAARAVPSLVASLDAGDASGIDAFIIGAFGDPGLGAARAACGVPVVGLAEAAMGEAAGLAPSFAIATITAALAPAMQRCAALYGCRDRLCAIRVPPGDPHALVRDPAQLRDALAAAVEACVQAGAGAVIIGGGPLAAAARTLRDQAPVPLIEPVPAALRLLQTRLAEDRTGPLRCRHGAGR